MGRFPNIRRGTQWEEVPARAWQALMEAANAITQIRVGHGLQLKRTGRHVWIGLSARDPQVIPGIGPVEGPAVRFKLVADDPPHVRRTAPWRSGIHDDHVFAARLLEEDAEIVRIAKDWDVRKGPWQFTGLGPGLVGPIDNITYFYEPENANWRTATGEITLPDGSTPTIEEKQVVIPRWLYGSEISAVKPVGGTGVTVDGTPLEWLELPKRVFTRKHGQGDWT